MGDVGNYSNLFHTASQRAAALFLAGRRLGYRLVREAERCRHLLKCGTVMKICDSRSGRSIAAYAADRYACTVRMRIPGMAGNSRSVVKKTGHFVRSPVNGGSIRLMRGGCDLLTSTSGATSARQSSAG